MIPTKTCTKCFETKPLDAFSANRRSKDGKCHDCKACVKAYYAANREKIAAYGKAYRAENPHAAWACGYRRRAKEFGHEAFVEDFTKADVTERYGDSCVHCGGPFEELDHYPTPVVQGGHHTLENTRPSCRRCNRSAAPRQAGLNHQEKAA